MSPSWQNALNKLKRWFEKDNPNPTARSWGSRGLGGGGITPQEVDDFLYGGMILFVKSSNVGAVQYHVNEQKMMVEYLGKGGKPRAYLYSNVSEAEALSFVQASSKGVWVWDHLRIRGTKNGHRKSYVEVNR